VPASISRMKPKAKTAGVTGAGIPADSDYSPFIHPVIIRVRSKASDGDSGLCINSRTCLKEIIRSGVSDAAAVHKDARSI